MRRACGGSSARNSSKVGRRGLDRFSMAEEAATAEEEEGDIHEDQKLEPSRDGASAGGIEVDADFAADLVGSEARGDASGGSACLGDELSVLEESARLKDCDEEEAAAELMVTHAQRRLVTPAT